MSYSYTIVPLHHYTNIPVYGTLTHILYQYVIFLYHSPIVPLYQYPSIWNINSYFISICHIPTCTIVPLHHYTNIPVYGTFNSFLRSGTVFREKVVSISIKWMIMETQLFCLISIHYIYHHILMSGLKCVPLPQVCIVS